MKRYLLTSLVSLVLSIFTTTVMAQGILVVIDSSHPIPLPRPHIPPTAHPAGTYKIKELSVQAKVTDQVARVNVSQSFVNTGSTVIEASFIFPLPYDGAVDRLTLMVDGKEIPAKLLPANEARSVYESIVRRNRDPALLEWIGTGMFKTNVFPVPPGAERKVTLSYAQLLRKQQGLTDFLFPLSTAKYTSQPVEKVDIRATIESAVELKNVYSPTHTVDIKRPDNKHATVTFASQNQNPGSDFRLLFDVGRGELAASVVSYRPVDSEDGYFLLLASPQIKAPDAERTKKTVVFAVDRSGSMTGKKIEQAREALKFVVGNLREGDLFNIVAFDSIVESFRPELQKYNDETRKAALGFVEGIYAGGGTNIAGALDAALGQLQDNMQPSFVIFLTDGLPTVGEVSESKIVAAAKEKNKVHARLINLGVGYDVNSRLLDRLARENFGQSEYVRPDENIELYVSRVYGKISSPVMTDVAVKIELDQMAAEAGGAINRMFPKEIYDLFEGEQLVIVGRYKKPGAAKATISGKLAAAPQEFHFPAKLVEKSSDESFSFVEKLWVMRRIGDIIDELDLRGKSDELVKELVGLSTKHGILTPYTSFLADETQRPKDLAARDALPIALKAVSQLEESSGRGGFAQRAEKKAFQAAQNAAPINGSAFGVSRYRDVRNDEVVEVQSLRNSGNQTLYARGKVWVTPETAKLDVDKNADQIEVIEQFTDKYFDLVKANTADENRLLGSQRPGEELLIKLRDKNYLVR